MFNLQLKTIKWKTALKPTAGKMHLMVFEMAAEGNLVYVVCYSLISFSGMTMEGVVSTSFCYVEHLSFRFIRLFL